MRAELLIRGAPAFLGTLAAWMPPPRRETLGGSLCQRKSASLLKRHRAGREPSGTLHYRRASGRGGQAMIM